jgi:hypothetical protein
MKQNHYVLNKDGKAVYRLRNNSFREVCKVSDIYCNMYEYKFAHVDVGSEIDIKYKQETYKSTIAKIKNLIKKWKMK